MLLLERQDRRGVDYLQIAMGLDVQLSVPALSAAAEFFEQLGEEDMAGNYRQRLEEVTA